MEACEMLDLEDRRKDLPITDAAPFPGRKVHVAQIPRLPDLVVEKIVSRIPFPYILKARSLSRQWHFKFPSRAGFQIVKPLPSPFLDDIVSVSSWWPTYCPAFVERNKLVGYDPLSNRWNTFHIPDSIPLVLFQKHNFLPARATRITVEGSLMCAVLEIVVEKCAMMDLLIGNLVTGSWRIISCPSPEFISEVNTPEIVIMHVDGDHYQLLLYGTTCCRPQVSRDGDLGVYVFDSRTNAWVTSTCELASISAHKIALQQDEYYFLSHYSAFLDGNIYWMWPEQDDFGDEESSVDSAKCKLIWKYNVQDNVFRNVVLHESERPSTKSGVVLCGHRVMLVTLETPVASGGSYQWPTGFVQARVRELNLCSLELGEVSQSPPAIRIQSQWTFFTSDSERIYFCDHKTSYVDKATILISSFNIRTEEWGNVPPPPLVYTEKCKGRRFSTFRPGLNPFVRA